MKRIKIILFLICIVALAAVLSFSISAADKCTSYKIEDHVCLCGITGPWDGIEWSSAGEGYIMYEDECNDCFYTYYFYEWDDHVYDTIELDGKQYNYCVQCEDLQLIESGETDPVDPNPGDPGDPGDPDDPYEPDDPDDPYEPDDPDPDNPDGSGTGSTCIHTYKASVIPPTCEERGYTWYECTKCDYAVQGDFKDPVPHEYEMYGQRDPTCTTSGMVYYTCKYCGVPPSADYGYLEPLGHNWSIYKSTIGDDKMITIVSHCDRCGNTKEEIMETVAGQAQNWLLTSIRGAAQGFIDIYETLANGIEVGGVTAGEVITGTLILIFIILMLAVIAKFLG